MAHVVTLPDGTLSAKAADFLHGCVAVSSEDALARPLRLLPDQMRAIGSCQAWHPGLYRQMARTSAGVTLEFTTDASRVTIDFQTDAEPGGTAAVLARMDGASERFDHDGVSVTVDGRHQDPFMPPVGRSIVTIELEGTSTVGVGQMACLPGFGDTHEVRVYLPALRGCALGELTANGTFLEPAEERGQLLVLGDSIAQGFTCEDPALSWPMLLADALGLDLVNQSIGGQVFQPGTLYGLARAVTPKAIVVAFGENYRYEPCTVRLVSRDIRGYLAEVSRIWPDVPTFVLTPLFHDEEASPSHGMSCWRRVPSLIAAHAAPHHQMKVVDGGRLMDAKHTLLADVDGHLNKEGTAQVAERLYVTMLASGRDSDQMRADALEILRDVPLRAFPLAEAARRGIGEFLLAQEGCVVLRVSDELELIYAPDRELGYAAVHALISAPVVGVFEPAIVREVVETHGLSVIGPMHLAIYQKGDKLAQDADKDIRPLDESYLEDVLSHYSNPGSVSESFVREALRRGEFFGGFEDDELVGYVGSHPEGAFGMIEVFPGHRRKGWGRALEVAKINRELELGRTPWCTVYPHNRASIALQKSLGLVVTPANEQCYLGAPQ